MSSDKIPAPQSPELTTRPEAPAKTSSLTNAVRARSGDPDPTDEEKPLEPGPDHEVGPKDLPEIGRADVTDRKRNTAVAATDEYEALSSAPAQIVEQRVRRESTSSSDRSTRSHQTEQSEASNYSAVPEKIASSASLILHGPQSVYAEVTASSAEPSKAGYTAASPSVAGEYEPQPASPLPDQKQYLPEPTTGDASQSTADPKEAPQVESGKSTHTQILATSNPEGLAEIEGANVTDEESDTAVAAIGQDESVASDSSQTINQRIRCDPTIHVDESTQNDQPEQSEVNDKSISSGEKEVSVYSIPLGPQSKRSGNGGDTAEHATADHVAPVSLAEQDDTPADAGKSHPPVALTGQELNPSGERTENTDQPTIEAEETGQLSKPEPLEEAEESGDPHIAELPEEPPVDAEQHEAVEVPEGSEHPRTPEDASPRALVSKLRDAIFGPREPADVDIEVIVDRPPFPAWETYRDGVVQYGTPLDGPDGTRAPLFDGRPTREQTTQGALNDCGVISTMGAVAEHRPELILDRLKENEDGTYEVTLHQTKHSFDGDWRHFEKTGAVTVFTITPDLPVYSNVTDSPAYASSDEDVAWPSVLEKAFAGVDQTWVESCLTRASGYERLDLGTSPNDRAEMLTQLTGEPAYTEDFPTQYDTQGRSPDRQLLDTFREKIAASCPVLVGTHSRKVGGPLPPKDLISGHAYEVTEVDDHELIHLHNPHNKAHPEPLTATEFRANIKNRYTTIG